MLQTAMFGKCVLLPFKALEKFWLTETFFFFYVAPATTKVSKDLKTQASASRLKRGPAMDVRHAFLFHLDKVRVVLVPQAP